MNALMNAIINKITSNINSRNDFTSMDFHLSNESLNSYGKSSYQAENIFNQYLPYAEKLDDEADALLAQIKANLGKCILIRDINPGCIYWLQILEKYIDLYGLRFTKEEHILLIKIVYELITIPNLQPTIVETFSNILLSLFKKKETISPDDLQLEWKPLYDLCYPVVAFKFKLRYYPPGFHDVLESLVNASKTYFFPSATQEILDEMRPKLCPLDLQLICQTFKFLRWFLPVELPVKYHKLGHELWFHEFMNLWEVCQSEQHWENDFMKLLSKLAFNNIGYVDWKPYIPFMFTRFMRSLKLPVHYKKIPNKKTHIIDLKAIGEWIASVLGDHTNAQIHLDKFLKTLETYFHPANYGAWLGKLETLICQINYFVVKRLNEERYSEGNWKNVIPENHKLTDANIDAFVKSMMPVVMTGIFNTHCTENFFNTLQYLAMMRPNLLIPNVVEKFLPTVGTEIEPHKALAAMKSIIAISRPFVQGSQFHEKDYAFTEGPAYAISILFSCLPSVDANDLGKSLITLKLIRSLISLIPIIDCSQMKANTEDEVAIYGETSRFEDFVLQLMDKIFTLIDSSSLEFVRLESLSNDGRKNFLETMAEDAIYSVFKTLLHQSSDSIFVSALNKLRSFIESSNLETNISGQIVGVMCTAFSMVNAQLTVRTLLPFLSDKILDIIGEGDDVTKEDSLDGQLLYLLLLLQKVTCTQGDALLQYLDTILTILDKVTTLKNREGNQMGCKMLMNVLGSLCKVQAGCFDKNQNDPSCKEWGKSVDFETARIKWYVPGDQEIAAAQNIFMRYFLPAITSIQNHVANKESLSRDDLQKKLRVINAILEGCDNVLPIWTESPLTSEPFESCVLTFEPILGNKFEIKLTDGSNVRYYLVQLMISLQKMMLKSGEDDTKSFTLLTQIWYKLSMNKAKHRMLLYTRRLQFRIAKRQLEDKILNDKAYLPVYLRERVEIQHELRRGSTVYPFTETSKSILLNVFNLSISQYSAIRKIAQTVFSSILNDYPNAYQFLIPHIIEVLGRDTETHHDPYKGVLHLITQSNSLINKGDWQLLNDVLPALVLSKPSEKPSIIQLQDTITKCMLRNFSTMNITLEVPDVCITTASQLWDCGIEPVCSRPNTNEIKKGVKTLKKRGDDNLRIYNNTLEKLLNAILEKNLHWRHRQLAMNFMASFIHPDHRLPTSVIRYFLGALIHDSIDERKMSLKVIACVFSQLKRKNRKIELKIENCSDVPKPGLRKDNAWLQYSHEKRPLTVEAWNEPRYIHKMYISYYMWPKKLEVDAPNEDSDLKNHKLDEHESEIHKFFNDEQNVTKLIEFLILEEKKGKDRFRVEPFNLFKGLFRNHGDAYLNYFLPHLRKMVQNKQESVQRCAAEIISGLIRGSKNWTFEMSRNMWQNLLPIIKLMLSNLTEETLSDWITSLSFATLNRDPQRIHWLIECLVEEFETAQSEVSFIESARLQMLQTLISKQGYRVNELLNRLIVKLEDRLLENPFDNVRDKLALILVTIFESNIDFSNGADGNQNGFPKMNEFVDKVYQRLEPLLAVEDTKSPDCVKSTRLLNSVCTWIEESVASAHLAIIPSFYRLFPVISKFENDDSDEELAANCRKTLATLSATIILPKDVPIALEAIGQMSRNSSWSARTGCVEFLQVFLFHNMHTLLSDKRWILQIRDIVMRLLQDERVEVREKSAQVLNGMLHCTLITDREALLGEFRKLAKTKSRSKKNETTAPNLSNAIRLRHAGVLGMCAFIQAHPYDVPRDIPPIFEHLSSHLSDPEPIPETIRKTLNNFKRTHCDGWTGLQGLAQILTEEQFTLLQDLTVPPAYYA